MSMSEEKRGIIIKYPEEQRQTLYKLILNEVPALPQKSKVLLLANGITFSTGKRNCKEMAAYLAACAHHKIIPYSIGCVMACGIVPQQHHNAIDNIAAAKAQIRGGRINVMDMETLVPEFFQTIRQQYFDDFWANDYHVSGGTLEFKSGILSLELFVANLRWHVTGNEESCIKERQTLQEWFQQLRARYHQPTPSRA
jgi:hypothetical protein